MSFRDKPTDEVHMAEDPPNPPPDLASSEVEPMEDDPFRDLAPDATDPEDPIVEACLEDALAPFEGALALDELADHRRMLTDFIKSHPLYDRLRGRTAVLAESGIVPRGGAPVAAGETGVVGDAGRRAGGRRR